MRQNYDQKIQELESNLDMKTKEVVTLKNSTDEYQSEEKKTKDLLKVS